MNRKSIENNIDLCDIPRSVELNEMITTGNMLGEALIIEYVQSRIYYGVLRNDFRFFRLLISHLFIDELDQRVEISLTTVLDSRIYTGLEKFERWVTGDFLS